MLARNGATHVFESAFDSFLAGCKVPCYDYGETFDAWSGLYGRISEGVSSTPFP